MQKTVNRGYARIYIQSAWMIPDAEKMAQETFSLKHTGDNFRKVVIDGSPILSNPFMRPSFRPTSHPPRGETQRDDGCGNMHVQIRH